MSINVAGGKRYYMTNKNNNLELEKSPLSVLNEGQSPLGIYVYMRNT